MTAKSETVGVVAVAWQYRYVSSSNVGPWKPCGESMHSKSEESDHLETRALIPIVDYEHLLSGLEALADVKAELAAWRELSLVCSLPGPVVWPNSWPQDVAIVAHLIWTMQTRQEAAEQKLANLLTGLEALAGEWDRSYSHADIFVEELRALIPAAAKEGT